MPGVLRLWELVNKRFPLLLICTFYLKLIHQLCSISLEMVPMQNIEESSFERRKARRRRSATYKVKSITLNIQELRLCLLEDECRRKFFVCPELLTEV